VLAADHAAERDGLLHDGVGRRGRALHHLAIVREDRDVHVHVAVAGVHVGGDDDEAAALAGDRALDLREDGFVAREERGEIALEAPQVTLAAQVLVAGGAQLRLGALAAGQRRGQLLRQPLPIVGGGRGHGGAGASDAGELVATFLGQVESVEVAGQLRQGRERQDDVLVQLEGVRALGDGTEPLAVRPEARGLGRVARKEHVRVGIGGKQARQALAAASELVRRARHHVDEQHRLRSRVLRRLGAVVDGLDVLLVEVLEGLERLLASVRELPGDVEDHAGGLVHALAEELEASGQALRVGAVQDELRGRDDPVGAFFLQAGQAAQGLVGDVLPQVGLADLVAAQDHGSIEDAVAGGDREADLVARLDLAQWVPDTLDPAGGSRG